MGSVTPLLMNQVDDRMQTDDVHDPMPNDEPIWHVDEVHDPMHIDPTEEDPIPMQIETNYLLRKRKREFDDDHERSSGRAKSISSSSSCRKRNRALNDLLFVDDLLFEQRSSKRVMRAMSSPASLHEQ